MTSAPLDAVPADGPLGGAQASTPLEAVPASSADVIDQASRSRRPGSGSSDWTSSRRRWWAGPSVNLAICACSRRAAPDGSAAIPTVSAADDSAAATSSGRATTHPSAFSCTG